MRFSTDWYFFVKKQVLIAGLQQGVIFFFNGEMFYLHLALHRRRDERLLTEFLRLHVFHRGRRLLIVDLGRALISVQVQRKLNSFWQPYGQTGCKKQNVNTRMTQDRNQRPTPLGVVKPSLDAESLKPPGGIDDAAATEGISPCQTQRRTHKFPPQHFQRNINADYSNGFVLPN